MGCQKSYSTGKLFLIKFHVFRLRLEIEKILKLRAAKKKVDLRKFNAIYKTLDSLTGEKFYSHYAQKEQFNFFWVKYFINESRLINKG